MVAKMIVVCKAPTFIVITNTRKKMHKLIYTLALSCLTLFLSAQGIEKAEGGMFLLKNGQVYDHDKGMVTADILIRNGVINDIGKNLVQPKDAKVVDCTGLEIYPGMIDAGTKLGIAEVGAVSLTQDHNEHGEYTPHMQALTAVNPSSVNIPVNRVNGVTTVLTVPSGSLFPGTAAAIDLHGYTPQQMYAGFKGVVLNFPSTGKSSRWDRRSAEDIKKDSEKKLKRLKKFWKSAKVYAAIKARKGETDYNPQMDAVVSVINDGAPLLINVNKKEDILAALAWVNKEEINTVFTGVSEGYRVIDSLVKYDIPVITGPILNNPARASDKYDVGYSNAGLMSKGGIKVAIRTNETENVRNLPYNAGFAAAYGMGCHSESGRYHGTRR